MKYDVAIIGGGIGGLMAAFRLICKKKNLKICIIEQGKDLKDRRCPAAIKNIECVKCGYCSITSGIAGAGAFSDGKFNLGTSYGGTLAEEIGEEDATEYIRKVDHVLSRLSNKEYPIHPSNDQLKLKCLQNNLQLLDMNVRHFGTDGNLIIMNNLIDKLNEFDGEFFTNLEVSNVEDNTLSFVNSDSKILAKNIIIATGRGGSKFVTDFCKQNNIPVTSNAVDIGVRVEMKNDIWKEFSDKIYEPKILCKTKTFEDRTRMFCFNQGGIVSAENNGGIITANGHAYSDPHQKTENCNFAILSSIHFTEPFNNPTEYAENISRLSNIIGDGNILVQRFGDLVRGRRTNEHRLLQNTVKPTLKATAGDISLVLPHRILTDIIETIYELNKVAPGTANDDTLLYGCEAKYYSIKPKFDKNFMLTNGVYIVGDGSGVCRGLSQSAAMGTFVADKILEKKESKNLE